MSILRMFKFRPREGDVYDRQIGGFSPVSWHWIWWWRYSDPNNNLYITMYKVVFPLVPITYLTTANLIPSLIDIEDILLPLFILGSVFSIAIIVAIFYRLNKTLSDLQMTFAMWHAIGLMLVCGFLLAFNLLLCGNRWLDFSKPVDHTVRVLKKDPVYRSDESENIPNNFQWLLTGNNLFVSSWRPNKKWIKVTVNGSVFNQVGKNDELIVASRAGAFGIEYHTK